MTLDEEGVPLFVSAACPAGCRDDPRGMPRGWRLIGDEGGRPVFANDTKRFNTFVDPRGLPDGFAVDQAASAEGSARRTFYMDHRTQLTSWQDPRATAPPSSLQKWLKRDLLAYIRAFLDGDLPPAAGAPAAADGGGEFSRVLYQAHLGNVRVVDRWLRDGGDVNATDADNTG